MNLDDAKQFVRDWLFNSDSRTTLAREWDNQHITDAALMLMDIHCKLEQSNIANKSLLEENQRLAKLRDFKTEKLRDLLYRAQIALEKSCTKPMSLIFEIREHLRLSEME